ncbi:MAG: LCP family protein [Ignavibacteria bacterium]|nr:LCP family protein [Ignavibacteria bacterium]
MNLNKFGEFKLNKSFIFKWIRRLVGTVLVIAYLAAVILVVRSNILPMRYLMPMVGFAGLLVAVLAFVNYKQDISLKKSMFATSLSLAVVALSAAVLFFSGLTTDFIKKIQSSGSTYVEYSIVAKKDQHIKLSSTQKQSIGIIKSDPNFDAINQNVDKLTVVDYKKYDNITSQTVALDTNESNMLVLSSSSIDLIKENYSNFYQNIEVLATFRVKTETLSTAKKIDITKPFIVYISGIDTYGPVTSVSRSDVNILAVVNPQTHKILLVNTPRDYYVQLHGTSGVKDKLTHAGIYGIDMSVNTLEDLYDIQIDYYLRVNFSSLTNIVNELNGVTVYSNYTFSADRYSFTKGYNQLNGEQALAFSRARYTFSGGDRTRGENQQLVIEAIIAKMNNPATLLNYQNVLASTQAAVQTNMNYDDMTSLIRNQLTNMTKWIVESTAVDGVDSRNYTYSIGNMKLYVMEPNQISVDTAKIRIQQNR